VDEVLFLMQNIKKIDHVYTMGNLIKYQNNTKWGFKWLLRVF